MEKMNQKQRLTKNVYINMNILYILYYIICYMSSPNTTFQHLIFPFFLDLHCPKEPGFCVINNGRDQNAGVKRLDMLNDGSPERQNQCINLCRTVPGVTGCELVWGQINSGCYAHTREIASGNGVDRHICWVMFKCQKLKKGQINKDVHVVYI